MTTSTTTPSGPTGQSHTDMYKNFLQVKRVTDGTGFPLGWSVSGVGFYVKWEFVLVLSNAIGKPVCITGLTEIPNLIVEQVFDYSGKHCCWDMYLGDTWLGSFRTLQQVRDFAMEKELVIQTRLE